MPDDLNSLAELRPDYSVEVVADCGFDDAYTLSEEELAGLDLVAEESACYSADPRFLANSTRVILDELERDFRELRLAYEITQKELYKTRMSIGAGRPLVVVLLALVLTAMVIIISLLTLRG